MATGSFFDNAQSVMSVSDAQAMPCLLRNATKFVFMFGYLFQNCCSCRIVVHEMKSCSNLLMSLIGCPIVYLYCHVILLEFFICFDEHRIEYSLQYDALCFFTQPFFISSFKAVILSSVSWMLSSCPSCSLSNFRHNSNFSRAS